MPLNQKIMASIKKGYRRPHDIEVLATEIYTFLCNDDLADSKILTEFRSSVDSSNFPDIIEITFDYLNTLSKSEGKLLHEEREKIGHLFDSINMMAALGLRHDDNIIKESDKVMLGVLMDKQLSNSPNRMKTNKPWWSRILYQRIEEAIPNKKF